MDLANPSVDPAPSGPQAKPIHIVAIALVRRLDRWLVARRRASAPLGGVWEFPGGKCEAGESPADAALRELVEECGVRAMILSISAPRWGDYAHARVQITPVLCQWMAGMAHPHESEECRWLSQYEIESLDMPAVNREFIAELKYECSAAT